MSFQLHRLKSGWAVDQAIVTEKNKLVVVRFGLDNHPSCMIMDYMLHKVKPIVRELANIYTVDIDDVPDFNEMYELYDPLNLMFFHRNKLIMIDMGTGDNNKITEPFKDKQQLIDVIELVYRAATKGKGLVAYDVFLK